MSIEDIEHKGENKRDFRVDQKRRTDLYNQRWKSQAKLGSTYVIINYDHTCSLLTINLMQIYYRRLINWLLQKLSTLIGQLATIHICDWLTKVKRIYEPFCLLVHARIRHNSSTYLQITNNHLVSDTKLSFDEENV